MYNCSGVRTDGHFKDSNVREGLENYVDLQEAGSRLCIHPDSVRRLIRQGKIPAFKFANKWLIRRDELEQFAR
ncbi:MAG: helix-turn-helix domain-containing protein, partial [Chloroflexi bacterium]|nr:helix-turn-helix domain-containing protein [Chloroflexota bacterium]